MDLKALLVGAKEGSSQIRSQPGCATAERSKRMQQPLNVSEQKPLTKAESVPEVDWNREHIRRHTGRAQQVGTMWDWLKKRLKPWPGRSTS